MTDIVWRTVTLPVAYAGVPYEAGLAVTGDLTAITNCVVASGSLPPGLAISADFVRITGTPTPVVGSDITKGGTSGGSTYTFTLTMTGTAGDVTSPSLSIKVEYGGPLRRRDHDHDRAAPGAGQQDVASQPLIDAQAVEDAAAA